MRVTFRNGYSLIHTLCTFFVILSRINASLESNKTVFILAILVSAAGICNRYKVLFNTPLQKYVCWVLCFLIFYAVSYFWSIDKSITATNLIATLGRYICYLYVISSFDSNEGFRETISLFLVIVTLNSIFILIAYGPSSIIRSSTAISTESVGNNNSIGMFSACAIIFDFYCNKFFNNVNPSKTKVRYLAYAVLIIMVILSGSKKAVLIPVVIISLMYFFSHRNRVSALFIVLIGIYFVYSLLILVPALYDVVGARIKDLLIGLSDLIRIKNLDANTKLIKTGLTASDRTRVYLVLKGLAWMKERPIFGYGMATYKSLFYDYAGRRMYSHNNYIEIGVGMGIVGLSIYYYRYLAIIKESILKIKNSPIAQFSFSLVVLYLILDMGLVSYLELDAQLSLAIAYYGTFVYPTTENFHNQTV